MYPWTIFFMISFVITLPIPDCVYCDCKNPNVNLDLRKCLNVPPRKLEICETQKCSEEDKRPWTDLTYEDLIKLIDSGNIQLFDVREPDEIQETGLMPGATNLPLGQVKEAFEMSPEKFKAVYKTDQPKPSDDNIVFSCRSGVRSRMAFETAHEAGYKKAKHFIGGWLGWEEKQNEEKGRS